MANILDNIIGGFLNNYSNPPQNPNDANAINHENVMSDYQKFSQNADPQQVYQAHESYYSQIPESQRENVFNSMVEALKQHGIDPSQAGVQGDLPTPQNLAKLNQYVSQKPDIFQSVFGPGGKLSSPLAKMALAGALAMVANKFIKK